MIALLAFSLLLSAATYVVLSRFNIRKRLLWVVAVLVVTFIAPMMYIMAIGDPPPPGSRVIAPSELQRH